MRSIEVSWQLLPSFKFSWTWSPVMPSASWQAPMQQKHPKRQWLETVAGQWDLFAVGYCSQLTISRLHWNQSNYHLPISDWRSKLNLASLYLEDDGCHRSCRVLKHWSDVRGLTFVGRVIGRVEKYVVEWPPYHLLEPVLEIHILELQLMKRMHHSH